MKILNTKEKIIKSGKKQFLEIGFENANLRRICKDAGVTTGAFYKYFSNKEELFESMVGQLAYDIFNLYKKYEDKSFIKYNSDRPISKKVILEILELKDEASIRSVSFFYDNKESFQLLIFSSYGTKYENFIEKIIELEDKNHKKILNMIYKDGYESVITDEGLHLINHAYMYALAQLVVHSISKGQAIHNTKIISSFFNDGWKKIRGL
ncbi:TetR/AcrR family transcriptional regulator [Anaerococcus porci]|uniref:TetR/AcrR family transcriptional regulator n=1 Tax=Anaerococcus porci TaxID=2652269 RepID=UPI0038992DC5